MSRAPSPPRILLVDPDSGSRELFGGFFQRVGWSFDSVEDGRSVVGALERDDYDIVIADVAMPGADGLTLLKDIFRKKPGQAVIAVSDDGSFDEALRFFRGGATDMLPRPIDFGWLQRIVQQVVKVRRQDRREKELYRYVRDERTELRFTSKELSEVDSFALPIVSRLSSSGLLEESEALKLKLAIQEAVVNALEHGNLELLSEWKEELLPDGTDRFSAVRKERLAMPEYSNREVKVVSSFDGSFLEIRVSDNGKGFLNGNISPYSPKSDSVACSGRGLALMYSAMDEVEFLDNGSVVVMRRKITGERR